MLRFFFLLSALLLVSACQYKGVIESEAPSQAWLSDPSYFDDQLKSLKQRSDWRYAAKVGVTTPSKREQANLVWKYSSHNDEGQNEVRIFGPLGVGAVRLNFDSSGAVVYDQKGLAHHGRTAEQLLTKIVGWPIPVDALNSWLFAVPDNKTHYRYKLDQDGNLAVLEQLGWQISYSAYREYAGTLIARKIVATRELTVNDSQGVSSITVKLITKSLK